MGDLKDPPEEREIEMGLVFKLTFKSLFLLAEVIAGTSLDVDEDPSQSDPLKIRPVFSIKGLAARADESPDT
jgi:hypothetical protein